jgi:hemerythrin-like metal-binding protein
MAIGWQASMEVGAPVLDAQRRALVEKADLLLESIVKGSERATVEKALKDFGDYAVRHFSTEEDCHLRGVCPALRWTGVARAELIKIVSEFRIAFERDGATPAVAEDLNCGLSDWVARYIPGPETVLPCVTGSR